MDNTFFLKIRIEDLIEVIFCIIGPKLIDFHFKLSFDHFVKLGNIVLIFEFCLRRKI